MAILLEKIVDERVGQTPVGTGHFNLGFGPEALSPSLRPAAVRLRI